MTLDIPVLHCPTCGGTFHEGTEFLYVPQADEYVCRDCYSEMWRFDQ